MKSVRALVLTGYGLNCDYETDYALNLAGAESRRIHINELVMGQKLGTAAKLDDYHILVFGGGFSWGDDHGAGVLFASKMKSNLGEDIDRFIRQGKLVIGICNGFQALVKAGLLPGTQTSPAQPDHLQATLTFNARGHFECRWVSLLAQSQHCIWTRGLQELIFCPVAHGEGNFILSDASELSRLRQAGQVALVYASPDGSPADQEYPYNPNNSMGGIAGVCNPQGNVLGLMPHPENHVYPYQHPRWSRGEEAGSGLFLFKNGVQYAEEVGR